MKLSRVAIRNFRSIKDLQFNFEPRCRTLVGINESGKSNILNALSYLSPDKNPSKTEIRYERGTEQITEAWVRFIFALDESDSEAILKAAERQMFSLGSDTFLLNKADGSAPLTIAQYCRSIREGLYKVDFKSETKGPSYWSISSELVIHGAWKQVTDACPADFQLTATTGITVKPKDFKLINIDGLGGIPSAYIADVTPAKVAEIVSLELTRLIKAALPSCIYWTYSEVGLLPSQVGMTAFAADPNSCLPLKNMFELAGIAKIAETLNVAKSGQPHTLRNLLHKVASATTQHVRQVWTDYERIRIELAPNADNIEPTVSETAASEAEISTVFDFARRSDGFKRFVTFLLLVSAKVKSNSLSNTLILIDEPEIGLHPSGAKHLMNELIRIARENFVVFSTHSISMIDKDEVGRHIIVEKKNEITTIRQADKSNLVDEEVIFRAIGYSIFETLKPKNVVFEGWRDKRLCQLAINERLKDDQVIQNAFKNEIGLCHADGVKDIRNITAFLEMAHRQCLVVSDDDTVAKEHQRQYLKSHGYGLWKRYGELKSGLAVVTGEDFIKVAAFRPIVDGIRARHATLGAISDAEISGPEGKLAAIDRWLAQGGIEDEERKRFLQSVKEQVFESLKAQDIEDAFLEVVRALMDAQNWPT